jgi:hypothetical protein
MCLIYYVLVHDLSIPKTRNTILSYPEGSSLRHSIMFKHIKLNATLLHIMKNLYVRMSLYHTKIRTNIEILEQEC